MSTRPSLLSTAALALGTVGLTVGALSGVAAADPPALDRDPCAVAIAAAGVWPGTLDVGHHQYRLVSDAYDSYLARQAECSPDLTDR